jgi:hypothetical protein
MKAKLIVNNQEIEVEISEEECKKLQITDKKETGYERVKQGSIHYYLDFTGEPSDDYDDRNRWNEQAYEVANYYSDLTVAENNARADKLMRQLRRFAVEHREKELVWNDIMQRKYSIMFEHIDRKIYVSDISTLKYFGHIYFDSRSTAQLAIDTFRDELIWYFTEYKDSL